MYGCICQNSRKSEDAKAISICTEDQSPASVAASGATSISSAANVSPSLCSGTGSTSVFTSHSVQVGLLYHIPKNYWYLPKQIILLCVWLL